MARIIKNSDKTIISAEIVTNFNNGTSKTNILNIGDKVTDLRYVENEEIKKVSGRVAEIVVSASKVTSVNVTNLVDNFSTDVNLTTITIDASTEFNSKLIKVPAMEIIEDEADKNVKNVRVRAIARETMDMSYSDLSVVHQDIVIGDILGDCVIMNGPGTEDTTGTFRVVAWLYNIANRAINVTGAYLQNLDDGGVKSVKFSNFISFNEKDRSEVTTDEGLWNLETQLKNTDEVYATLSKDIEFNNLDKDGYVEPVYVEKGKKLNLNLNGHTITAKSMAFYVNGGELNISGKGKIVGTRLNSVNPVIHVDSGVFNMYGGEITVDGENNSLYGVACANDAEFNMYGGKITTDYAPCISITNKTAVGDGAKFTIGGDSVLSTNACAAIYLADNKLVTIKDKAIVNGGIVMRMGTLNIEDNATVNSNPAGHTSESLDNHVTLSGVCDPDAAILGLCGSYGTNTGSNDLNINVAKTAKVVGNINYGIQIAKMDTNYDQKVRVNIDDAKAFKYADAIYRVYDHDELATIVDNSVNKGKFPAAKTTTDVVITIAGKTTYPGISIYPEKEDK